MTTVLGKFDVTGTYYACVVERPGKRELQIHPLQTEQGEITISSSLSSSFELDTESQLVSIEWVSKDDLSNGKRSKRRQSNGSTKTTKTLSYISCAFKNGTITTFSPFQKEAVHDIKTPLSIRSISSGRGNLWVSGATEALEYDVNDSKSKSKVKYPKDLKNITHVNFATAGEKDYIVTIGNKIVVQESVSGSIVGSISIEDTIESSTCIDGALFTSKDEQIRVYTLPELKQIHMIHAKGPVSTLYPASSTSAASVLSTGQIQIYKNVFEKLKVLTIRPNSKEVKFTSASLKDDTVLVSWIDLEPKFQSVDINTTEKSIKVDVKHEGKSASKKNSKVTEQAVQELEPKEQYQVRDIELAALIGVKSDKQIDLLTVLVSNPEESKIKNAVAQLEDHIAVKVYRALQTRISADPTESSALNNWLKWVVISHPAAIQSLNSFKPLKTAIKKSLKQLPDLLALQGRLELLQSQLTLRNQIAKEETTEGVDLAVAQAEESIVYVNGENDEAGSAFDDEDDDEEVEDDEDEEQQNGVNGHEHKEAEDEEH